MEIFFIKNKNTYFNSSDIDEENEYILIIFFYIEFLFLKNSFKKVILFTYLNIFNEIMKLFLKAP